MSMNRREFLALTTATAAFAVTDCLVVADNGASTASGPERVVDAGPAGKFAANGVYDDFRDQGFFVIRKDDKLFALSIFCTHRKCKVKAEPDKSFYCRCHGSTYDPGGHVTKGPAKSDLPILATSVNEEGHLLVKIPAT